MTTCRVKSFYWGQECLDTLEAGSPDIPDWGSSRKKLEMRNWVIKCATFSPLTSPLPLMTCFSDSCTSQFCHAELPYTAVWEPVEWDGLSQALNDSSTPVGIILQYSTTFTTHFFTRIVSQHASGCNAPDGDGACQCPTWVSQNS